MDSIRYELREDDIVTFSLVALKHSARFRQQVRYGQVALVFACLLLGTLFVVEDHLALTGWMLIIGAVPVALIFPRLMWRRMSSSLRSTLRAGKNTALLGAQELQLMLDGVRRVHPHAESKIAWLAIERLMSSRDHLGIFISAHQAFVVPKRSFGLGDEGNFRARVELLSGKSFVEAP
jgi:hypothetical protein